MLRFLTLVVLGISLQLVLANIEEDLQNLNVAGISDLPLNISMNATESVEKAFAEKCKKRGGQEAYDRAKVAKEEAVECVKGLVNFDQLQQEMEAAKPTGDLDSVFKKYCKKSPQFKGCIANFTTAFEPCLEDKEKESVATVLNVTEQLAEFICYKEGDRIALFIAEGGPECINASSKGIEECIKTVFNINVNSTQDISTIQEIPLLLFKVEQCQDFFKLQTCVVKQLEKCQEPTPANIVDSLFNFVRKVTPCSQFKFVDQTAEVATRSSSPAVYSFITSLSVTFCSFAMLRLFVSH